MRASPKKEPEKEQDLVDDLRDGRRCSSLLQARLCELHYIRRDSSTVILDRLLLAVGTHFEVFDRRVTLKTLQGQNSFASNEIENK